MRNLVSSSLAAFERGPIAGLVFSPRRLRPVARKRILARKKRRLGWLTQQAAFWFLDGQYKYLQAGNRRAWARWGRRYRRTSYAQYMSVNLLLVLQGRPTCYSAFIARYGYLVPSTWT